MADHEISLDGLRRFGQAAYAYAGLTAENAEVMVEAQLDADLRGVDTHGFERLPWYVERLRKGENNPRPELKVLQETPASLALDVDNGLGQLVCVRAMERTLAKARQSGVVVTTLRHSNDWGCAAYYPKMAAEQGFVAFASTANPPVLAPFGASTRRFGNSPMVYAVPRRAAPPMVLDMALSTVALGKLLRASAEGQPIPLEWGFRDPKGQPTTDPDAARAGVIPAIGGYKGVGLSLMMTVLAGILPGGYHTNEIGVGRRGQFFLLLSPSLFTEIERFYDETERMIAAFKASELLPGVEEVYLPGELEQRQKDRRLARGAIAYPRSTVESLRSLGNAIGVEFPS